MSFLSNLMGGGQAMAGGGQAGGAMPMPAMPGAEGGLGGLSSGLDAALASNQQQQMQAAAKPKGPSGFMNALGMIGDALLVNSGHAPMYAPHREARMAEEKKARLGQMLGNYLGNLEPGLAEIFAEDPGAGMSLYKMKHPAEKDDTPSAVREFEYYSHLPPEQQPGYRKFRGLTRPQIIGSPTTGYSVYDPESEGAPPGAPNGDAPTVNSQEEYDALPTGARYRDSQGNPGVKRGGPTATPSVPFP